MERKNKQVFDRVRQTSFLTIMTAYTAYIIHVSTTIEGLGAANFAAYFELPSNCRITIILSCLLLLLLVFATTGFLLQHNSNSPPTLENSLLPHPRSALQLCPNSSYRSLPSHSPHIFGGTTKRHRESGQPSLEDGTGCHRNFRPALASPQMQRHSRHSRCTKSPHDYATFTRDSQHKHCSFASLCASQAASSLLWGWGWGMGGVEAFASFVILAFLGLPLLV